MGTLGAAGGPWFMGLLSRGERALEWALWLPVQLVGPAVDTVSTRGCLISRDWFFLVHVGKMFQDLVFLQMSVP